MTAIDSITACLAHVLIGGNSVVVSQGSAVFRVGRIVCVKRRWLHVF